MKVVTMVVAAYRKGKRGNREGGFNLNTDLAVEAFVRQRLWRVRARRAAFAARALVHICPRRAVTATRPVRGAELPLLADLHERVHVRVRVVVRG